MPSHCTNTVVFHGQPFTQMLLIVEMEVGQDTCEAFEPAPQRVLVVALPTDRVCAEESVVNSGCDRAHQRIPPMVVDVIEALSDPALDDQAVDHRYHSFGYLLRRLSA